MIYLKGNILLNSLNIGTFLPGWMLCLSAVDGR